MAIEASDLIGIARKALANAAIHPTDLRLKGYLKVGDAWHIDVLYKKGLSSGEIGVALAINAETGEIRGFWEGRTWK